MTDRMERRRRRQKGMFGGAVEQQMVLAAAAIVVVAAAGTAYVLLGRSRAETEWQTIDSLVTNTRDLYTGEPYPAASLVADLITNHRTGNAKTSGGNSIINNYGGTLAVTGNSANFTITDNGVPQSDCVAILKRIPSSGYLSVAVNGAASVTSFPLVVATAEAQCGVSDSSGNSIVVTAQ